MSPRKHTRNAPGLLEAVKEAAWRQISAEGAAALSLRAIARGLGITAPAIYNYFHRRDDLVTALVVDAYRGFGDSQATAVAARRADDHAGRLRALGVAYRAWATANPERYQLMFSAPYPGYVLPVAVVGAVAGRALSILIGALEAARKDGVLRPHPSSQRGTVGKVPGLSAEVFAERYGSTDPTVLLAAVRVWARVHGLVAIELSRQYPPYLVDPDRLYREELEALVNDFIAEPPARGTATRRSRT